MPTPEQIDALLEAQQSSADLNGDENAFADILGLSTKFRELVVETLEHPLDQIVVQGALAIALYVGYQLGKAELSNATQQSQLLN